jgi:phosphohistidine phosphatase
MRTVVLLRHAHASPDGADFDRPLSAVGVQQLQKLCAWLDDYDSDIGSHLTGLYSPSLRTRSTFDGVQACFQLESTRAEASLYDASLAELVKLLSADSTDVLIVAHNPGLESLLALLTTGQSGAVRGMSPGTIAILELPDGSLTPGNAKLRAFFSP